MARPSLHYLGRRLALVLRFSGNLWKGGERVGCDNRLPTIRAACADLHLPALSSRFAELSFEALGTLRLHLMSVLKEQGIQGIRELSKQMKRDRRDRPKTVLKLNKSVYGIPDAGQAFSMFIQGLHKQKRGLAQSEMDPCIFYKVIKDEETDLVKEFLVAITWVDDCRYFGTDDLVAEYEKVLTENCKCTLEGIAKEFVSIQIIHNIKERTMELTQEDYWVNAHPGLY
jgi:hypothetical protein